VAEAKPPHKYNYVDCHGHTAYKFNRQVPKDVVRRLMMSGDRRKKLTKNELLDLLESSAVFSCKDPGKPGIVVEGLLFHYGDEIRDLKSEDVKDVRIK